MLLCFDPVPYFGLLDLVPEDLLLEPPDFLASASGENRSEIDTKNKKIDLIIRISRVCFDLSDLLFFALVTLNSLAKSVIL